MAAACARGFLDLVIKQHSTLCFRSSLQVRQFATTSQWNAPVAPPRKPPSAFIEFFRVQHSAIVKNNPDINTPKTAQIAAQMWYQLNPEEKKQRLAEASDRLVEYRRQYALYKESLTPSEKEEFTRRRKLRRQTLAKKRKRKEVEKLGKPKRPRNPFILFVKSSKLERGDTHITIFLKKLVDYWKVMPQEEKDIYIEDARLDRIRYDEEMAVWEKKMKEMGREDLIREKFKTKVKKVASPLGTKKLAKKMSVAKPKTKTLKRKTAKSAKGKTKSASTSKSKSTTSKSKSASVDK